MESNFVNELLRGKTKKALIELGEVFANTRPNEKLCYKFNVLPKKCNLVREKTLNLYNKLNRYSQDNSWHFLTID